MRMMMTFEQLKQSSVKHGIKVVWEDWHLDSLRDRRVGFNKKYEKVLPFLPGDHMFVYLTSYQRIFGLYEVKGDWAIGKQLYPATGQFSSSLPVELVFDAKNGIPLNQIQTIVPFQPARGLSYMAIDAGQFQVLYQTLQLNG
jgi:hypothetical protein